MKLLSLRARNFRSFAELDLDLNVDGLVAVVGPNGAGKTSIFDAIEWGLYGVPRGRGGLPARRDGCPDGQDCWVDVEFEVGGRAYKVRRVDGKDAALIDLASGQMLASGRDGTSLRVATLLGLSRDMFRGTFYARQREIQALESEDGKRRAQVELLLGIERLRVAAGHAATAAKEQQHLVRALEADAPNVDALKAEVERIEREAQQTAPAVQQAEARLDAARAQREQTKQQLEDLRAAEREMNTRRARAQTAQAQARQETAAADALAVQVTEADAASEELERLAPIAAQVEVLAGREREMDLLRVNHERAANLRHSEHQALTAAAGLADQLAQLATESASGKCDGNDAGGGPDLGETDGDPLGALRTRIEEGEAELETLRGRVRELADQRQTAERRRQELGDRIAAAGRAAALDGQLADLAGAEQAVEDALTAWHALQATRTQLEQAISHDTEHRDAVLAGEAQAACPTCKRDYDDGELDEIVARFDADLTAARGQLATIDTQLAELKSSGAAARARAEQARTLAADRRALGDVPGAEGLEQLRGEIGGLDAQVATLAAAEHRDDARISELVAGLPQLRQRVRQTETALRQIDDLKAKHTDAERQAAFYARELARVGSNGYDPEAFTELRSELAAAQQAGHRCAALRAKVDGLELLARRLVDQRQRATDAQAAHEQLAAAAAEAAVDEAAMPGAEEACRQADIDFDAATTALIEANRHASSDSEAVTAVQVRLHEARQQNARLREQRRELRVRTEVANALSAYREEASRLARPTLERETALLLGQTTGGRYSAVQLTDGYQLEIVDGRQIHPLRRFSGGEQDLAGLCLRLALSRTLARQRGAETGFVLLDEVFGSQDTDRRRALLEQLHAIADSEFRQVFVVSHTDDVVAHCDLTIEVTRGQDSISAASGPRR
jgi:exonuclease SbcC